MKTRVNTTLFILSDLINQSYSEILQLIDTYICADSRLENEKCLLMYDFEDNDVEAQQLIDTIVLQQYYIGKNLDILEQAMEIKEKSFFMDIPNSGILIGLN